MTITQLMQSFKRIVISTSTNVSNVALNNVYMPYVLILKSQLITLYHTLMKSTKLFKQPQTHPLITTFNI